MKRFIYPLVFFVMVAVTPFRLLAQSNTLVIYATPVTPENTLDSVVAVDQHSGSPHAIYQLVSTDTPYVYDNTIVVDNNVSFIGVPAASDGRLPCIQPNIHTDATIQGHMFAFTKAGSVVKLQNLYLLGISTDNTVDLGDGFGVSVNADNIKCYIDNVVFEQWTQFSINFQGAWDSFWITNCKFRNSVNSGSMYTGEAFRMRNDLGTRLVDTVVMKYNTFLAVNAYAFCVPVVGTMNYGEFSHNSVVCMVKNPFFSMPATNLKIEHNIFYATYTGGMANGEYPWWDRIWSPGVGSTIDFDTLSIVNAVNAGIDTTKADWSATAEAARKIDVNDNIYFRPQAFTDFYTAWNDTAHGLDSIYTTEWMNDLTTSMFSNKTRWPGFNDNGNLVGTDPGYGSGITNMIGGSGVTVPPEDGAGMIPYIAAARANNGVANVDFSFAQSKPDYSSGNWVPTWPLPEANDLKYSANLTATDGKPYGDPYWFNGITGVEKNPGQLPGKFSLSEAYPNPFNPSTNIKFTISEAGNVSLKVYNTLGQLVKTIVNNEYKQSGEYDLRVDMSKFASGIYLYRLEEGNNAITKKMILLK